MTREEALTILNYCDEYFHIEAEHEAFCMARNALKDRPHGEWIISYDFYGSVYHYCYKCGYVKPSTHYEWDFCPNCGASMRKEGDKT